MIRLLHIGVAVKNLEEALNRFSEIFDLERKEDEIRELGPGRVRLASIPFGNTRVELVQPISPEHWVTNVIAERGEGLYHVSLEVDDLDGMLNKLEQIGVKPIPGAPKSDRVTFVEILNGVKLELVKPRQ